MTLTGVSVQRARRITVQPLWWLALLLKSKSIGSRSCAVVVVLALPLISLWSLAEAEINEPRAKYHYQMFCQGCHTPDGSGVNAVPPLKEMMGVFLRSQRGREFMVQVPGSATSKLKDAQLAEVLNWCIENFAGSSLINGEYRPYTADEVGRLRQSPLQEIDHTRAAVLAEIARLPETGEI